jgi:hypothetical protein
MIMLLSFLLSFCISALSVMFLFNKYDDVNRRLIFNLSLPIGIGISSYMFVLLNLIGLSIYFIITVELLICIYLLIKQYRFILPVLSNKSNLSLIFQQNIITLILLVVYIYSWLMNAGIFYFDSVKEPHGLWDAWSYWNMKAKFICRAPDNWPNIIHQLNSEDFHGDYPLMQSAFIAKSWILFGKESVWIPIITSFCFTFCSFGLLSSAVGFFTSLRKGLIAGLVLLATPFFITLGDAQYADVTVGFFFLATIVFIALAEKASFEKDRNYFFIAAGVMSSMAAWSKNEGLLFILCLIIARSITKIKKGPELKNELKFLVIGMLPIMTLLLFYKFAIAPPNDLIKSHGETIFTKLTDVSRYKLIGMWFMERIRNFGEWIINPWWLLLVPLFFPGFNNGNKTVYIYFLIFLMIAGYFFSYVISYIDLTFHLSTSLHRLFFQLFPAFIFVLFMSLKKTE